MRFVDTIVGKLIKKKRFHRFAVLSEERDNERVQHLFGCVPGLVLFFNNADSGQARESGSQSTAERTC